ncbi:hypothetical protein F4778DRAFT_701529 [Xylariomycetidae sp. FL2044]|nr:hypothetical protein F4778DRAFT_701529 [Xylariomycetidae sp. FL2044]
MTRHLQPTMFGALILLPFLPLLTASTAIAIVPSPPPSAPSASASSCLESSLSAPAWTITNLEYEAAYVLDFTVTNTFNDVTAFCLAYRPPEEDEEEQEPGEQEATPWTDACSVTGTKIDSGVEVSFDGAEGRLEIRQEWVCEDDVEGTRFVGSATLLLPPLQCSDGTCTANDAIMVPIELSEPV